MACDREIRLGEDPDQVGMVGVEPIESRTAPARPQREVRDVRIGGDAGVDLRLILVR